MSFFIFYINFFLFNLINLIEIKNARNLYNYNNEIHLAIEGNRTQNILSNKFEYEPSSVFINGIQDTCKKSCYLTGEKNNITLIFSQQINSYKNMFQNLKNIIEVDLSNFDSSQVTDMAMMFMGCSNLISVHLSNSITYKLVNISNMFNNCYNLISINFGNMVTSSVEDMERLFYGCSKITTFDFSKWDISKVTSLFAVFYECRNLKYVNFGNINTSSIVNMRSLFYYCNKLESIDLSKFDTSKVTTFQWMFNECKSLTSIDISSFNTSNCESMFGMFNMCSNLISIKVGNIDISSVVDMERLFYGCSKITSFDLSIWDLSKVTSIFAMFFGCSNLESVNFGNINTSSVTNMRSLFYGCSKLEAIDLSKFDTSEVTTFQWMFYNCKKLKYLNLSHFNTSKISNIFGMFAWCSDLIYLNIFSFKLDRSVNITTAFTGINPNVKYCIYDNDTKTFLLGIDKISECSDPCFNENNKKVDIINNTCIESCKNNGFNYEYKTLCYEICPNDSYILYKEGEENFNNDSKECFKPEINGYYLDVNIFKRCHENCKSCYGKGNDTYNNCKECKDNYAFYDNPYHFTNCYPICYNYYYFDVSNNFICTNNLECPEKYKKLIKNKKKCIDECIKDDIYKYEYNNLCYQQFPENTYNTQNNSYACINIILNNENITQKLIITNSNIQVIYECKNEETLNINCNFLNIENETEILNIIKENINSLFEPETGKSQVIKGGNDVIFQVTNGKNEKELLKGGLLNNQNLTILDLGECENILKNEYKINENDSLIYLKKENINVKASEKNVQYEIFHPYNYSKLNLTICKEEKVNIYFPLVLSDDTRNKYENMKLLGYDMLNINDPFYQDLCTQYETENNTDMPLSARKDYIYNNKDSKCQENCHFSSYLPNSLYINCTCNIDKKEEKKEKSFNTKKLYESFYEVLKYANFNILKCYNLIFNKDIFQKNIGNYVIFFIISIYFICFILFIIKGIEPLKKEIEKLYSSIQFNGENNNNNIIININNQIKNKKKKGKKNKNLSNPKKKNLLKISKNKKGNMKIKKEKNKIIFKKNNTPKLNLTNLIKNKSSFSLKENLKYYFNNENINDMNKSIHEKYNRKLEEFELNQLEYEEAICYDKRTFIKIYINILRREHLIIFTFFTCNDYNILYIKYTRFIFLFATDMAMNVFFFSDDSMHKIFLNYGKYNFIQQIPQIIYTTIISQLIEVFLCFLSLTDKHIYEIKNIIHSFDKNNISIILKYIKIKLVIFFIFTFILLVFYWYTITSFCAVYENTQITFIKDSLLSFLLSILYPLVIYLIPSGLRIISLKNVKMNLKCIYKLSDIIPFF